MEIDIFEMIRVFAVGGAICIIGQLLLDFTNLNAPKILVLFVASGAILTLWGCMIPLWNSLQTALPYLCRALDILWSRE